MSMLYSELRSFARANFLSVVGTFKKPAQGIHILSGHRIENEKEPQTFLKQLDNLAKYVTFVRIEDAVQMILKGEKPDVPIVSFAFDDGFVECYDIFAPALEKYGVNAIFFVNPNYVEGDDEYIKYFNTNIVRTENKHPMRWNQIKELSDRGFIIGAHTMNHYMINSNDKDKLHYEIDSCKEIIEAHTGKTCDYFAFPYGRLSHANEKAIEIALAKYKYVFSQTDYKHYFSFDGRVINRRHFEPFWPLSHVKYFLSCHKTY